MASPPKISKQVIPENREMDDYFMAIAFLTAQRGSDRAVEAGAVVVNEDNCIMATGYSDLHKCSSGSKYPKELFVAHAEASAILSANCASLKNNRIYVTRFPGNESAKLIVQSGISKVLYASHEEEGEQYIASGKMLRSANIECEQAPFNLEVTNMAANSETSKPIDMDDYFMAIAFLTSKLSKDPETKVGAVIVNEDNCIVGTGYNDFPSRCGDVFFWHDKKLYVVHAEANAMLNRNCASLMNTRIYTTLIPCNECAKLIKQAGISKVLYASDEKKGKKYRTSANMLTSDHIEHKLYKPKQKPIVLNFV